MNPDPIHIRLIGLIEHCGPTAIDNQVMPGHEPCGITRQVEDGLGDIIRCSQLIQWHGFPQISGKFLELPSVLLVSGGWSALGFQLDGWKFQGSRSSMRFFGCPAAMASSVDFR